MIVPEIPVMSIRSVPDPAVQASTALSVSAAWIASRSVQFPVPVSAVVSTMMVAARTGQGAEIQADRPRQRAVRASREMRRER